MKLAVDYKGLIEGGPSAPKTDYPILAKSLKILIKQAF